MITGNPYQPPASDPSLPEEEVPAQELAPLGDRLGAAIIDAIIISALLFAVGMVAGNYLLGIPGDWFWQMAESDFWSGFIETMVAFFIFAGVQGYLLAKNGQTIGKKLLGIKIVTMEGKKPRMEALLLLRTLVPLLLETIPTAGPYIYLAGIIIIFARPRRCFHDYIAGTKVVQVAVLPRGDTPVLRRHWKDRRITAKPQSRDGK
ncbi:MAG: RDD family protein [Akkermansiaceae bacterium]|nr:RDD family protein [Akkermansiaceae bacterium]